MIIIINHNWSHVFVSSRSNQPQLVSGTMLSCIKYHPDGRNVQFPITAECKPHMLMSNCQYQQHRSKLTCRTRHIYNNKNDNNDQYLFYIIQVYIQCIDNIILQSERHMGFIIQQLVNANVCVCVCIRAARPNVTQFAVATVGVLDTLARAMRSV